MVLAKLETTYGIDPTPTAGANLIAVKRDGLSFSPKFNHLIRRLLDGTLSKTSGLNVPQEADFSLTVEVRGNRTNGATADISAGSVANKVEIDALLRCCDLTPTYTAETTGGARDGNVIYKPVIPSDMGESVTLYFYTGTKVHKIVGCKGNVKGSFMAGDMASLTFDLKGIYVPAVDAAIPGSPTWLNTKPPIFVSSGSTVDSFTPIFQKLDFDLGNAVVRRDDANSAYGMAGAVVTARDSKVSIDPESVAEATSPIWGDIENATSRTITCKIGSQTGNKFQGLFVGVSQNLAYGERTGIRTTQIDYSIERANPGDAANAEFQLKFF